jgi:hypothetical protein
MGRIRTMTLLRESKRASANASDILCDGNVKSRVKRG